MSQLVQFDLTRTPVPDLRFELLRGGLARLGEGGSGVWTRNPFTLIGQLRGQPLTFEVEGRGRFATSDGSGYIFRPQVAFRSIRRTDTVYEFRWMHVQLHVLQNVDLFHFLSLPPVLPPRIGHLTGRTVPRMIQAAQRVEEDPVKAGAQIQALGLTLVHELFHFARIHGGAEQRARLERLARLARVAPVLQYMETHLAEAPRKEDLARVLHLSETRFHEVFLDALGMPPMKYLQGLRIKRAQAMLWHSEEAVAAIGRACGYGDPFHFSRTFKAVTGESPRAFRARARRQALAGELG